MDLNQFKSTVLPIKNKLYRFALRMLGDPAEAEDVVQEVLIKVWNQRADLTEVNNIEAWCMRLTKNKAIDKLRLKHRNMQDLETVYDLQETSQSPYAKTAYSDTLKQIKQLMEELPEKQKQVMHLRDIEGMPYQEISDSLEMSMSNVKVNLFRARQNIRAKLLKTESYGL
ncbi:MAG: RNA polymerase sigma factor [Bacteroidota bacterium]